MSECKMEIVSPGDENGNHMIVKWRFSSGLEVTSLPTANFYGGEWDLGPTWNYLVTGDRPFLVDTGRFGRTKNLLDMLEQVGVDGRDIDFIVLSHGHEDHDGGAAEFSKKFGTRIKSHSIYDRRIRFYPEKAPQGSRPDFPAACWHCFMPESFSKANCLEYHQDRADMPVFPVGDGDEIAPGVMVRHVPGHSPDSLAIFLGDDAVFTGDAVLPQITPFPTTEKFFEQESHILGDDYKNENKVFGLKVYLDSLAELKAAGLKAPDLKIFPAHRLYYDGQWNDMNLAGRIDEILSHHTVRGLDILDILSTGPQTAREITLKHFKEKQLKGFGVLMGENEVVSHLELLQTLGDVSLTEDGKYFADGGETFSSFMKSART